MGMGGTRSGDTGLEGAFVPDSHIARIVPAGLAGADYFVLSIFAWALGGFGNIYYGLAQRMLELSIEQVKNKTSLGLTRSMAHHPEVQHGIADMVMGLEAIGAQLETCTQDWSNGGQHPEWPIKIGSRKYNAVETAGKKAARPL